MKRAPKLLTGAPDLRWLLKTDHMFPSAVGEALSFLYLLFEGRDMASSLNLVPSAITLDSWSRDIK